MESDNKKVFKYDFSIPSDTSFQRSPWTNIPLVTSPNTNNPIFGIGNLQKDDKFP